MSIRPEVGEALITCPYDKAHRLKRQRLQQHLLKCRQQYPEVEMTKCPFDQTHLVPKPELEIHVLNCPGRSLISQYKYNAIEAKEEERGDQPVVESNENWDDTDAVDYIPQKYAERVNVLRRPDLFQPSERKAFVKQERKRLGEDSEEEDVIWTASVKKETCGDEDSRPSTPPPPKWPTSTDRSRSPSYDDNPPKLSANGIKCREPADYVLDDDPYYNGNDDAPGASPQNADDNLVRRRRTHRLPHIGPMRRPHHATNHN